MSTLQTLDRGLRALQIIAENRGELSIAALAARLDVHRAIAYRIVATLEGHGLVVRGKEGGLRLGAGVALLAGHFLPQLRRVAQPLLEQLAHQTRATAFVSVAEGDEAVVILVAEPDEGLLRVGYRLGSRHPLSQGAAGIAILAGRHPEPNETEAIREARQQGYSMTRGQLQQGAVGVASPIVSRRADPGVEGCVGVVAMEDLDIDRAATAVMTFARRLAELMES
ncbi:MAG: IclR family transcriptional regulator [Halomonas sp.]